MYEDTLVTTAEECMRGDSSGTRGATVSRVEEPDLLLRLESCK
jgi:hypothetical protein